MEVLIDSLGRRLFRPGAAVTHTDEHGLIGYLEHPVHQELLVWLRPRLADRAVVDAQ